MNFCTSGAGHGWCQKSLGFRREYWQLEGALRGGSFLGNVCSTVPDLALEAGSFVRPDGGDMERRRAGVRDQFLRTR